jgi:carbamoyl-phosphate synthase large subunit
MGKRLTVMFSSAGRRGELIGCFRRDAKAIGVDLYVVATDSHPELSAACQIADVSYRVPRCTEAGFVEATLAICRKENVDMVIPMIDTELQGLSAAAEKFDAIGTRVVISSGEVIAIARDKLKTSEVLKQAGVQVPRTAPLLEVLKDCSGWAWPLILKPRGGSSSVGIIYVESPADLGRAALTQKAQYIAQERWFGDEYTVNMFFDKEGDLCCVVPHKRIETRGGEVSKGRTERLQIFNDMAHLVAKALPGARGPLCFQAIRNDRNQAAVFEINARFGGGYPLAHQAGAHFPRWLLQEASSGFATASNDWRAGVTMLRYDTAVFKDDAV